MTNYKFAGDGACVPGLPLEVSEIDLAQFNVEQRQAFDAAFAAGVYVEVSGAQHAYGSQPSAVSDQPLRRSKSKKSEVTDEGA